MGSVLRLIHVQIESDQFAFLDSCQSLLQHGEKIAYVKLALLINNRRVIASIVGGILTTGDGHLCLDACVL